jgi:integrase
MAGPGRQPLPIGSHGKITVREVSDHGIPRKPKVYRARTLFKDPDGEVREVTRTGGSEDGARNNLRRALTERKHDAGVQISGETRIADVADAWFATFAELVDAGDRSPSSLRDYESAWRLHCAGPLGRLRVREGTAARCEAWLKTLRKHNGAPICSRARRVMTAVFGYAVRMGAIPTNPMREVSPIPGAGARTRKPRSMTREERREWLDWIDNNLAQDPDKPGRQHPWTPERQAELVASRALGDITRFHLATGCRIGETMAVSWDEVDFEARTVYIGWHLIRVKGDGLVRVEGAKSDEGERLLQLPGWCVDMLMRRRVDPASGYPVFPDALGGWRDPNLIMRWLRWSRDAANLPWLTSHVFRQTVITTLGDSLKEREVADHAGHADTAQTRQYIARKVRSSAAADVLEEMI